MLRHKFKRTEKKFIPTSWNEITDSKLSGLKDGTIIDLSHLQDDINVRKKEMHIYHSVCLYGANKEFRDISIILEKGASLKLIDINLVSKKNEKLIKMSVSVK